MALPFTKPTLALVSLILTFELQLTVAVAGVSGVGATIAATGRDGETGGTERSERAACADRGGQVESLV